MDAATQSHVISQIGRLLDAEVIYQNRECRMGQADLKARQDLARAWHILGPASTSTRVDDAVAAITKPEPSKMPTIAEQLKAARAQLTEARDGAAKAVVESQDASRVVLGEVNKVLQEASDLRAEVAELTNGGPL